jgi:hypothetical protein
MARQIARPRVLTPSDTPIFYSMIVPGIGQIMLERPLHGLFCAGLFTAAWFSHRDPDPPLHPAMLGRYRKEQKRKRLFKIVSAWVINVADTMALCRWRTEHVDTRMFFSIMESLQTRGSITLPTGAGAPGGTHLTPGLTLRIVFR